MQELDRDTLCAASTEREGLVRATRRFDAAVEYEKEAQRFLTETIGGSSAPVKVRNDLRLALEELFVNVASYAYGSARGDVDVSVAVDEGAHRIVVELSDEGVAFDPFSHDDYVFPETVEDAQIGGLGILLVERLMDEVAYRREEGRNVVTIAKSWKTVEEEAEGLVEAAISLDGSGDAAARAANAAEKVRRSLSEDDLAQIVGGLAFGVPDDFDGADGQAKEGALA